MKTRVIFRAMLLLLLFTLFFTGASVAGTKAKVMTYNVDEGTDFGPIISVVLNGGNLEGAVGQTIDEVVSSNPILRMQLIANEIASAQPDVVGLQEAALWTAPSIPGGTLDLLETILVALQGTYIPIETVDEFHIALTLPAGTVSFTDRDVILVRSDLAGAIGSHHGQGHYSTVVPLTGLPGANGIARGWAYVDVAKNGTEFRFITTHLEDGTNTASPIFLLVQASQEIELVTSPLGPVTTTELPVIIGGDFNTIANDRTSPTYLTYLFMLFNGFTDAWTKGHSPFSGATCCQEDLTIDESGLTNRVDQIFSRNGVRVIRAQLLGNHLDTDTVTNESSWPSDHAAVEAELQIGLAR